MPKMFEVGTRVARNEVAEPYPAHRIPQIYPGESRRHATTRRLRVFTQDPSTTRFDSRTAEVEIPYEPLTPGPRGSIIVVDDLNETRGETYDPIDLDDPGLSASGGLKPTTADPGFAQQMTYALAMATYERFRLALGRAPDFAFEPHPGDTVRHADGVYRPALKLHIQPHAFEDGNAEYDPASGSLRFGYTYAGKQAIGGAQEGSVVFTSLSHDVVIHETSHALLDGMRAEFMRPTHPDVDGFHEGFADLIALFSRFRYEALVARGIEQGGGKVTSSILTEIAREFGRAILDGRSPLRRAFEHDGGAEDDPDPTLMYSPKLEAHDMGALLVRAVFDAFRWIFDAKTTALRSIAAASTVTLPDKLVTLLAEQASRLAGQFLNIIIRAVDYCPPVDLRLGEYLRAIITADTDLVPDDPWAYREMFVHAFRRYGVRVEGVADLSEEALLWQAPEVTLPPIRKLAFRNVHFDNGPFERPSANERNKRAEDLGEYVTHKERLWYFGLAYPSDTISPARIESLRMLRRVRPDGNVNIDLVAEVIQYRTLRGGTRLYGGCTIIIDTNGDVRFVIAKQVMSVKREKSLREHLAAHEGYREWFADESRPAGRFRQIHRRR